MAERSPGVIGRDEELQAGDRFLDAIADRSAILFLEGEPGIGKTTVWNEICVRARRRRHVVLATQPGQSEAELPFAGLLDLVRQHVDLLHRLPTPQRRALEVALARAEPAQSESVGSLAASAGFLSMLTMLAAESPVVVAIDDLQWMDVPSLRVVGFAARRLGPLPVGLLASVRLPSPLDPTVPTVDLDIAVERFRLQPLPSASLFEVIDERLGVTLPRYSLTRIEAASGGNTIVAIEMARGMTDGSADTSIADVPIPATVVRLVSRRVAALPAATRLALLRTAALARPTTEIIALRDLAPAIDADLLTVDHDGRIRFTHPLFARVVYATASARRRATAHRWLSERIADQDERVLHAALASPKRDGRLARRLHEAAERARRKGAPEFAAGVEERAAARTPVGQRRVELQRRLRAAEHHERAGNVDRALALAEGVIAETADAALRARGRWLIAEIAFGRSLPTAIELLEMAIGEPGADAASVAELELHLAVAHMAQLDLDTALPHARRAEELADEAGDTALLAEALGVRMYVEAVRDDRVDHDAYDRSLAMERADRESPIQNRPTLNAATLATLTGRLATAEGLLQAERRRIIEAGEDHELPYVSNFLAFTELLHGEGDAARRHVAEALHTATVTGSETMRGYAIAVRGVIAAFDGDADAALADARDATSIFDRVDWVIGRAYVSKTLAIVALCRDDIDEVERQQGPMAAALGVSLGYAIPAMFVEELIDARLSSGTLDQLDGLLSGMEAAGRSVDSPIARVIAARGRALLESARGHHDAALEAIARAQDECDALPIPSERARTLLAKGQILRRIRRKAAAREAMAAARAIFEGSGMRLWVERTDDEIARIGLQRRRGHELTATERRIAELAASGLTNRQIAAEAFVSPKTVEDVMSRVYDKLGIRSRAELGARMGRRC